MTYLVGYSPHKDDSCALALACQFARSESDTVTAVTVVPRGWETVAGSATDGDFEQWAAEEGEASAAEAQGRLGAYPDVQSSAIWVTGRSVPAAILDEARFKQPARRRSKLELEHVRAFVCKAIEAGRVSLALGTALQFETTLRQRDVIGEWEPIPAGEPATGIVLRGRRWVRGLTWADISADLTITKETSKTGAVVGHDLRLCPLVLDVMALIAAELRVGPLIIDEKAGRPYAEHAYAREWRTIARAADIPDTVWNMDARAGGTCPASGDT